TGRPLAARAGAAKTCAFLRVRVLPSGPWGFCRTFALKLPQLADWGRDPLHAGEPSKSMEENDSSSATKLLISTASLLVFRVIDTSKDEITCFGW
ncbi:unnamed protein product, partial [Ectocarpus sp. 13 AM-2016]